MKPLSINTEELPYYRDADDWARYFADLPGFVFLDSRKRRAGVGQYDIITALPDDIHVLGDYDGDAFRWMEAVQDHLGYGRARTRLAVGYLDYDSAAAIHGVTGPTLRPAAAGIYQWYLLQDHQMGRCWLMTDDTLDATTERQARERIKAARAASAGGLATTAEPEAGASSANFRLESPFKADIDKARYLEAVNRVRDYIAAGDCYQVNLAHRFSSHFTGAPYSAYRHLRDVAPGDFSAFLQLSPDHAVMSLSPERFLSVDEHRVRTQPIKGTSARSADPQEDAASAQRLRDSIKDRAENVMIVDLLRNDLGRYCQSGSVKTPELCALHSFDNVHHLVSMVEGQLRDDVTPGELLLGCSPGGSITGAPKRRAVEIIRELEPAPRGVYCGSVFALGCDGWLQSSIAIRTLEAVGQQLYCWGGGGIVFDSDPEAEYRETLDKIGVFMRALESI